MRRGFTIIELVMVIAILGILLGIVTTAASNSIKQARKRKADACCKIVQAGLETYYSQHGYWPGGIEDKLENDTRQNEEGSGGNNDPDVCVLDPQDLQKMMRDILLEYKKGNPCLDISGLFVSRCKNYPKSLGMDFMTAIHGTKKEKNGQRMSSSEMYFGYPESEHGYFRHFKVIYSRPTDQMKVSTQ